MKAEAPEPQAPKAASRGALVARWILAAGILLLIVQCVAPWLIE